MALVALDGTPLVAIGMAGTVEGVLTSSTSVTIDAANESCQFVGQIFTEDGGSHTIDTTGSSSLGWLTSTVTFANAGTTLVVGLAAVDTAAGPPARAVNVANVVTFNVSKTLTGGGGGVTGSAWQEHVPGAGTMTIANGDRVVFAVQATARAGADSVLVSVANIIATFSASPSVTQFTGSYSNFAGFPNAVITFSDGKLGFFYGGYVHFTAKNSLTWNSGSATKEYGNLLQMPFPAKIYGLVVHGALSGDADFILYSDPLGTPVAEKTVSVDLNTVGSGGDATHRVLFSSPYSSTASQPLGAIVKPTSVTNVTAYYKGLNASAHQKADTLGTNGYAINRASGAFAAQGSSKDRFGIGLLVGAFEHGVQPTYAAGIV